MAWQDASTALKLPWVPAVALGILLLALGFAWVRERRTAAQRRVMQRLYKLGEELTAGRSAAENLRLLQTALPELLRVSDVRVHVLDRTSKKLSPLDTGAPSGPGSFCEKAAELCFLNRTLIAIPDTRRSPFFDPNQAQGTPRSAAFIPMFAQEDLMGVLQVSDAEQERHFSEDEAAVAQHLGNQIAIGMKLLEQKALREHALGGERLETVCRLVTAAAAELRQPIIAIASALQAQPGPPGVSAEARRAAEILSRLLMFTRIHQEQEQPVDLAALLQELLALRERAWAERDIRVRDLLAREPVMVIAQSSLLEQVFLSVLRHLEERLTGREEKVIAVRAFRLGGVAQANLTWPGPAPEGEDSDPLDDTRSPSEDVLSLAVCRDLIRGQGGRLRIARDPGGSFRLEVELPLVQSELPGSTGLPRAAGRSMLPLTTLVLEPDSASRSALISALSDLGHRSVPASNTGEAVDLVGRLHFHALFCSAAIPGEPWPECFEKTRGRVDAFVLLTHGHDPALSAALPAGESHVLAKPVRQEDLARFLEGLEARVAGVGR